MSRSIDLFIRAAVTADELASTIAQRTGLALERDAVDGVPVLADGPAHAALRTHGFDSTDDLVLSRYEWALSATTAAAGHLGDTPETRMLRRVSSCLASDHAVLLVLDLQYRAPVAPGVPAVSPTG